MCRLIETICVKNGCLHNMRYHQERMNTSGGELFGPGLCIDLGKSIEIPEALDNGLYKCRVVYTREIESVEFTPYTIRPVSSLRLIRSNIEYPHKYEDRILLQELFARREGCDDILIVRDGLLTDTSYANIAFCDGKQWVTPSTPLLPGTKRRSLLEKGILKEAHLTQADIRRFREACLINAMLDIGDVIVPVERIVFPELNTTEPAS